jgi:PAS domain S-box-containing protein
MQPEDSPVTNWEKEYTRLTRQHRKLERDYKALAMMYEQTERLRNANEAARELSAFYTRLLLRNTPCITFMLDTQARFVMGSEKTLSFLGYRDMRELVEAPFAVLFAQTMPDAWIESMRARCQDVMRSGRTVNYEEKAVLRQGLEMAFQVTVAPAITESGDCKGAVVVMSDISDLARAREDAEQASRAKSSFLANMSHEMRTPMNAIIGMTTIARGVDDPDRKDACLSKIEDASTHLLGVINDILDMSKIEANKFTIVPAAFNLERMIRKVVNVITFRAEEKKQHLSVRLDDALPEHLISDDQRLAQVIANLLSNAVKFTPEQGTVSLDVSLRQEKNGLCDIQFEVADTGIGISEEQKSRLFSAFEQADSGISRKFGGTGLGLAISKRIVEMLGGKIWVTSEFGKGSTFAFTIQARRAAGGEAVTDPPAGGIAAEADNFAGRRLLLAEDVEINREIVLALLEPTALNIDCAENGEEALRMFSAAPEAYDMIFMDVQMPVLDGYEATRRIRALPVPRARSVPIVAMTANVFREDVEKCLAAGMNDHVGKPLSLEEVLERLRRYLPR